MYGVLQGGVEGVDHGWLTMPHPVGLVHLKIKGVILKIEGVHLEIEGVHPEIEGVHLEIKDVHLWKGFT